MPMTQHERQGILVAAAATAAQRPEGTMRLRITLEGKSYDVDVEMLPPQPPEPETEPEGAIPESVLAPPLQPDIRDEDRVCRSPIAGAIVNVPAETGHWLRKDQPAVIIEAMKMQISIGAPVDGIVEEVAVAPGDAVKPGQVLCKMG